MKTKFYWLALLASAAMIAQANAGGHHGSGGGGFAASAGPARGGGRVGGFASGSYRAAPSLYGGGFRAAPSLRGAYFTGRSVGRPSAAPRFNYGGARTAAARPSGFGGSVGRPTSPNVGRSPVATRQPNSLSSIAAGSRATDPRVSTAANRQPNRVGSVAGRNQVSDRRTSTVANRQSAANRQSFIKNHASERHDANWHNDWDRHHAHFHDRKVFVFIGGFWWGLDPWFYPYYASGYYPYGSYDYSYDNPSDYSYNNPYDYDYYNPSEYDGQPAYVYSNRYGNDSTLRAVQSQLAKLGYYSGAIDGVEGDETQAALARYQQDYDLSVTGTLTPGTLQALGLQ